MFTKNIRVNTLIEQLSKFGLVGGITTTFSMISYYILLDILHSPLYPTYIGVYVVAVFFSYLLNSRFTFKEKINIKDVVKYYVTYLTGLCFGIVLLYILDGLLDFSNFILVLITIPFRVVITFFFTKNNCLPPTDHISYRYLVKAFSNKKKFKTMKNLLPLLVIIFTISLFAGCQNDGSTTKKSKTEQHKKLKKVKNANKKKKNAKPKPLPPIGKLKKSTNQTKASIYSINENKAAKDKQPFRLTEKNIVIKGTAIDKPKKNACSRCIYKNRGTVF